MVLSQKISANLSEEERLELISEQSKLNDIHLNKVKGAFVRSRKRWREEGEQNSAYFCNLERHHGKVNVIQQLHIDGVVTDNRKRRASYCSNFVSNL